jgi:hypothetical protein
MIIRCYLRSHSLAGFSAHFRRRTTSRTQARGTCSLRSARPALTWRSSIPAPMAITSRQGRLGALAVAMRGIALSGHRLCVRPACTMRRAGARSARRIGGRDSRSRRLDRCAATGSARVAICVSARVVSCGSRFHALPVCRHRNQMAFNVRNTALRDGSRPRHGPLTIPRPLARAGRTVSGANGPSCARVNAAFHLLTSGNVRVAEVAMQVGYASSRSLTRSSSRSLDIRRPPFRPALTRCSLPQ